MEEVTLDQIYEFVPDEYKYIKEKELELEYQVLQPNEEVLEIYNYALSKGKKIIIVSDMFLPKSFIEKILEKNGYNKYHKLFLSSEYKKLKASGNLFRIVLEELQVLPKEILHIGDHRHSDYKRPKKLGIEAIKYTKIINQFFNKNKKAYRFYKLNSNNLTISIIMGCLAIVRNEKHNYWYNLGLQYGGAFILSYIYWLKNALEKDNIKEVLFVARDGYTLEKVYKLLNPNGNEKTSYFYAPRLISLYCTLDIEHKINATEYECIDAISSIINYYKPKTDSKFEIPDLKTKSDYLSFWNEHKPDYQNLSVCEREKYMQYLSTLELKDDKVAFVDIMTTFFTGHKFLQDILNTKFVKGYYYFVSKMFDFNRDNLHYEQNVNFINKPLPLRFIELLISSPEPPIIGIENNKPIYKNVLANDQIRMDIYPDISQGELDFAQLLIKIFGKYLFQLETYTICEWLNYFPQDLSFEDYKNMKKITHSWNANHSKYSLLFDEFGFKNILLKIFSLKNNFEKTHKIITILGIKIKIKKRKH